MPKTHDLLTSAVDIAAAYVRNHHARAVDVPALLSTIHATLTQLAAPSASVAVAEQPEHRAAMSVRQSLASREHIISMIDGKPYRALKRHLTANGLTPDQYRQRYDLKPDYPIVASAYSEARSATAKALGLGRKAVKAAVTATVEAVEGGRVQTEASTQGSCGGRGAPGRVSGQADYAHPTGRLDAVIVILAGQRLGPSAEEQTWWKTARPLSECEPRYLPFVKVMRDNGLEKRRERHSR